MNFTWGGNFDNRNGGRLEWWATILAAVVVAWLLGALVGYLAAWVWEVSPWHP